MNSDQLFRAAFLLHVGRLPGMCPNEKLLALLNIAPEVPHGDVVEIGTWWGKSALALLLIARRYRVGNVLCIDPWTDADLVQGVPHVDEASAALSADEAFDVFLINLMPYCFSEKAAEPDLGYWRFTSLGAAALYKNYPYARAISGRRIMYTGHIALLHIDGNHAYAKVKQDVELWAPLVVPGGWIIIDDYDWRHGDGPKRAADELIAGGGIGRSFVAGGAMFAQRA